MQEIHHHRLSVELVEFLQDSDVLEVLGSPEREEILLSELDEFFEDQGIEDRHE